MNDGKTYDDWFLPSKVEIEKMYINLKSGTDENGHKYSAIGAAFNADHYYYWSSSEYNNLQAWAHCFDSSGDNFKFNATKTLNYSVRAIRAF